jgi:hypothetical protein
VTLEHRQQGYTGVPPFGADPCQWLTWVMNAPETLGVRDRIAVAAFLMLKRQYCTKGHASSAATLQLLKSHRSGWLFCGSCN